MTIDTKLAAGGLIAEEPAAPAKKKTAAAKLQSVPPSKNRKAVRRPPRRSRARSRGEKLVCRYCGSDDLAPSFRKRRDARCRACFKKRYGSASRKKSVRAQNAKAAR
jgi:hypothetical protein